MPRALAALLGGALAACGASHPRWTPPPDRRADAAVVYVSTDCSAVLVGPRTALTAAHCVEDPGPMHVRVGGRRISVEGCAVHPSAYGAPRACGAGPGRTDVDHDLAVLTLEGPTDVAPVDVLLTPPELRADWWRARAVRLVGWDRRPALVGPLARRSGENRIIERRRGAFVTEPDHAEGFHTIVGDSGGPALLRVGGVERVAGVLRGGPAPGSRRSVYAATFEPDNARWLLGVLPTEVTSDLRLDESSPFGAR